VKAIKIHIELEPKPEDEVEAKHATTLDYVDGMWSANGPLFPRITTAMHEILQILRGDVR